MEKAPSFETKVQVGCDSCPKAARFTVLRAGITVVAGLDTSSAPMKVTERTAIPGNTLSMTDQYGREIPVSGTVTIQNAFVNSESRVDCKPTSCPNESSIKNIVSQIETRIVGLSRQP